MKNDYMKAAAEDLKVFCEHNSCYEYAEDEKGHETLISVCPFLEKDEKGHETLISVCPFLEKDEVPEDAHCVLEEPYGWHLERMR